MNLYCNILGRFVMNCYNVRSFSVLSIIANEF